MVKQSAPPEAPWPAAAALRKFWRVGRASWARVEALIPPDEVPARSGRKRRKKQREGYVYGHKLDALYAEATQVGLNGNTLRQAWRAAQEYTAVQVVELCALVTEHRARFGPTHLTRLLAVGDRTLRDAMTRKAIRGRWGVARLGRAIQAANGVRRPGVGKKPSVPAAEPELLAALGAQCDRWTRWCVEAGEAVPESVEGAVRVASRAVDKVKAMVAAMLAAYAPTRG